MFKKYKEYYPRFNEVIDLVRNVVNDTGIEYDIQNYPDGQLAVQVSDPNLNTWLDGVGKAVSKTPEWEHQFQHINPLLKNSVIEDYLNWLEVPVYRTRIMVSRPKSCYSIHKDSSPRLHLPLITNPQCNFVFTDPAQLIHMPADGSTYWVDTRYTHTFMNGSLDARIHLVMIVKE